MYFPTEEPPMLKQVDTMNFNPVPGAQPMRKQEFSPIGKLGATIDRSPLNPYPQKTTVDYFPN